MRDGGGGATSAAAMGGLGGGGDSGPPGTLQEPPPRSDAGPADDAAGAGLHWPLALRRGRGILCPDRLHPLATRRLAVRLLPQPSRLRARRRRAVRPRPTHRGLAYTRRSLPGALAPRPVPIGETPPEEPVISKWLVPRRVSQPYFAQAMATHIARHVQYQARLPVIIVEAGGGIAALLSRGWQLLTLSDSVE